MYPGSFLYSFAIPIFGIRGYLYGYYSANLSFAVQHIIALSALGNLPSKNTENILSIDILFRIVYN